MPVAYSTVKEAKSTVKDVKNTFKNTAQSVLPTVKQLKSQGGFKSIMRWYTQQADEYGNYDSEPNSYDDPEIDGEGQYSQITEIEKSSNQVSKAVVESTGKLAETQLEATANIVSKMDSQISVISAGFNKTNSTLEEILTVLTKNSATLIETMTAGFTSIQNEKSANDKMLSRGKFNLSDYKKIIKSNIDKSDLGPVLSMIPLFTGVIKDPKEAMGMLSQWAFKTIAPNLDKNIRALDDVINNTLMDSIIRLGEGKNGKKNLLAQIFGIDSNRKSVDTSRSELELKSTPFDTIAKEAITNAIPGYLRKILVALGGPDEIYDYRSRSFQTKAAIKKEFREVAASTGTLRGASSRVRSSIGNDDFSNMLYDLLITDLGSKTNGGEAREIINKLQNKRYAGEYMRELVKKYNLNGDQLRGVNIFARNLSNATKGKGATDISTQVARTNVDRYHRVSSYIDNANRYEIDLSDIDDSVESDLDTIAASVGITRNRKKKSGGSSVSATNVKMNPLQGINYTNMALYEIYRRLNEGINVFQVGSKHTRRSKFKPLGDDYLSRPSGYKPRSIGSDEEGTISSSEMSMPTLTDEPNELMNQELEDGTTESLTKGQRFARWGKSKGKALGKAMFFGSPSQVKAIFGGMLNDVAGVASESAKNGISRINSSFGNISGYLQHKMFGHEYSYQTGVDEQGNPIFKKIAKNEKGGIFGFVKDNVSDMFKEKKDTAKDWFKDVIGFFDYSGDDPEEKQIEDKRKKILSASVGAMAGMGILGGPIGLLAGAIAGNALSGTGIGKKIKEKLFGREDGTGKAKGLFNKAIDGIIDPIHYQVSKTMKTAASALKNNILAPLGDIGRAIRDRAVYGAKHYFRKFFKKVFDNKLVKAVTKVVSAPFKLLGKGIGWAGKQIGGGLLALPGALARGAIRGGSGLIGGGLSGIAQHIAAGTKYGDNLVDEEGNVISGRQFFKNRREEQLSRGKRERDMDNYKTWKAGKHSKRASMKRNLREYTDEQVVAENTTAMEEHTSQMASDLAEITHEATTAGSLYTHDKGLHERLDKLLQQTGTGSIISGSIGLIGTGDEVSNDEEKLVTAMAEEASRSNANSSTIVSKFKNLLGINKKKSEVEAEKKSSLFTSLIDGIGGILSKGWPIILGGLALLSSNVRGAIGDAVTSIGNWAIDKLPEIISGGIKLGAGVAESVSRGAENIAMGASTVSDPVTGELKSVMSAEKHSEKIQNGVMKSAVKDSLNPARIAKDMVFQGLGRTAIRGALTVPQIAGGTMAVGAGLSNGAIRLGQRGISAGTTLVSSIRSGSGGWTAVKDALKAGGSSFNSGIGVLDDAARAGSGLASKAKDAKQLFARTGNAFNSAAAAGSVVGGMLGEFSASLGWNYAEYKKHSHLSGDYGMGENAGGFRITNTSAKTATTFTAGLASGFALGKAIMVAKAAASAAAASSAAGPVGWVVATIAAIIALSALLGGLINMIVGAVTDKMDEDYAIRSNSSKLHAVIGQTFTYENGAENPMYVYAGRESDRVLGITKGVNMRDPEIVLARYMKKLEEGLNTAPGAEMLLYDFINNMAVQGVPFACYVAGDSDKSKTGGSHANSGIIKEFEDTDKAGLIGFGRIEYTQVKKSTVKKNKDKVFADIAANIERQDSSLVWSEDDLTSLYNNCKDVVDQLKSEGIIKSNGKINTKLFKGSVNSGKNDEGWKSLDKLCRKNGAYFLSQSIVYINSKIDCDKSGQQWMQYRIDDIKKLTEGLSDVFTKEKESKISEMKASGMSDSEIKAALEGNTTDPSGETAEGVSTLTKDDYSPLSVLENTGIKSSDKADVSREMRYLVAAYAYSHPEILQKWVQEHSEQSEVSVDNQDKISNWKNAFKDKRQKAILRNQMAMAALKFADDYGDLFNIIPKIDWSQVYNGYNGNKSPGDEYGAGFILRGYESKPGEGKLSKLWDEGKVGEDNTPEDIHKVLFGNKSHGKGSEVADAKDIGWSSTGIFGFIGDNISKYPSSEGSKMFDPNNNVADCREAAVSLAHSLSNSPTEGKGGPVEPEGIDTSSNAATVTDGGNPLNEPYKITSGFGPRTFPHSGTHKGVDIVPKSKNRDNVEVGSRFDGTVIQVKSDVSDSDHAVKDGKGKFTYPGKNDTGNMVTIKTDDGLVIKNMHLAAGSIPKSIREGARVKAGDKIGIMGSTGWSTGKHLHYQIEKDGEAIDPEGTLNRGSTISSFKQNGSETYSSEEGSYSSSSNDYDSFSSLGSSSETTSSGSGVLGDFISSLMDIGNNFLSAITGGLIGSSSSTDSSNYDYANVSGFGSFGSSSIGGFNLSTTSNSEWVNVVRTVKEAVAAQQPSYNQGAYITINVGGRSIKTRTDCTGIICSMLKLYGVVDDNYINNSYGFMKDGAIPKGFDKAPWPGWDNLIEGDIIVKGGHAEVFARNEGSKHLVYNGGSTNALCSPGATSTGHKEGYSVIWRCREASSLSGDQLSDAAMNLGMSAVSAINPGSSLLADFTKDGYNGSKALVKNPRDVWRHLRGMGFTENATAGIMGCWESEGRNSPSHIEGDYLKGYPGHESVMQSTQSRNDYTTNFLFPKYKKVSIKKGAYIGQDGNYYPGIGFAQWTGPRALDLMKYAQERNTDWGDAATQLDFFNMEMDERKLSPQINSATDTDQSAKLFAEKFEVVRSSDGIKERQEHARSIYNQFRGVEVNDDETATDGVGGPEVEYKNTSSIRPMNVISNTSKKANNRNVSLNDVQKLIGTNSGSVSYKPPTSSGYSESQMNSTNPEDILKAIYLVLDELRNITGNTSNSNSLLETLNEKDFVDQALRDSLNSIGSSRKTKSSRSYYPTSSSVKSISAMARP